MENSDIQGNYQQSEPQWVCPDCEIVNSGDNCTVCGCPRPQKKREESVQETATEQGRFQETATEQGCYAQTLPEWICPDCETRNTGAVCAACGRPRPEPEEKKKRISKKVVIAAAAAVVILISTLVGITVWLPYHRYQSARKLLESGQYEQAYQAFSAIEDYRDSAALLEQSVIRWADGLVEEEYYEQAVLVLEYLPESENAAQRQIQVRIQWAEKLSMNKEYIRALSVLKPMSQMEPIPAKMQEIQYNYAMYLLNEKQNYGAAYQEFVALGTYRDSELSAPEAAKKWILEALDHSDVSQAERIRDTVQLSRSQKKDLYKELYTRDIYDYSHADGALYSVHSDDLSVRRILLEMLPGSYPNKAKLNTLFTSLDVSWPSKFVRGHKDILKDLWYMPVVQNVLRNDECVADWLLGTWRTENGSYYLKFYQNDSGGISSQYTLPWIPNPKGTKYFEIRNLTYVLTDEDSNVLAKVYRFNLLEPDKIEVYAFKNQKTYTLVRK